MPTDIEQLKYRISYTFKNRSLMREAVTHRTYAMENQLKYDNQRLEFLGDAVLEIILSEFIFSRYPTADEGMMTKLRSALAQQDALATLARRLELGDFLLMGHGERDSGGGERDSTLSDLFEALLGAIYLDGGLDPARSFVMESVNTVYPDPAELLARLNPKGTLQEYTQRKWSVAPTYEVIDTTGPDHLKIFTCEATVRDFRGVGSGANRREAECEAARQVIEAIAAKDPDIKKIV